jgi:hypothetical protein
LLYVQLDETNEILVGVTAKDLRRNYRNLLTRIPIHSHVVVMLKDDTNNSLNHESAQIVQYHVSNNSYDVRFDDGELLHFVSRRRIKLIRA